MPDDTQRRRVHIEGLAPARKTARAPGAQSVVPYRIGHGHDIHRLQPGGRMVLGGVVVSEEMSPISHSDGDVVIHALVDALLGSLRLGDIGEIYSENDPEYKGFDSKIFLRETCDKMKQAGYQLVNADITIQAERPRISPFKRQMVDCLEGILGSKDTVNIKAGTNEGCDAVGRGEAIAADVVVFIEKS